MSRSHLLLVAFLLLLPITGHAASQSLNLTDPMEQQQWNVVQTTGVSMQSDGIHVQVPVQGSLLRSGPFLGDIDVLVLTYASPNPVTLFFAWHLRGARENAFYQIPISLKASDVLTTFTVDLSAVKEWDRRPDRIGFIVPAGTTMLMTRVDLSGVSLAEKIGTAWSCFWKMEGLKARSINFFWGPLLCYSPVALESLFKNSPPIAESGMRVVYAILILGMCIFALQWWRSRPRSYRVLLRKILFLSLVLWIVLDIRMGAELLHDWRGDQVMYLSRPLGRRIFRDLHFFPDFAEVVRSSLVGQSRYVLLTPTTDLFNNFSRYTTFPSQPVTPENGSGALIWLVYERPELTLDAEGRIIKDGQPFSPPGTITHEFMKGTYIFRVNTPSSLSSS